MSIERGSVIEFEEHKGVGVVEDGEGRRLFFHCTAIVGGSRTIAVGTEVVFQVSAGHRGCWEATSVTKLG